jgi:predicted RNA-binding protein YlxR (DUF448 family)
MKANTKRRSNIATSKKSNQPARVRHVPQRTCIACHTTKAKRELLRIVRTPIGHIELDEKGKKSGRGAYLCARYSCWELALKKGRLEQEFEMSSLPAEDRMTLETFLATLPPDT